jgi:hypothetical protein
MKIVMMVMITTRRRRRMVVVMVRMMMMLMMVVVIPPRLFPCLHSQQRVHGLLESRLVVIALGPCDRLVERLQPGLQPLTLGAQLGLAGGGIKGGATSGGWWC